MTDDTTSYGFLCGADMAPGDIRSNEATRDSHFVDIGSVPAGAVTDLDLPLPGTEQVWGVVVTLPGDTRNAPLVPVTLRRSGEVMQAALLTDADTFGDRDAVLAEAYYWELPREWREALTVA